MGISCAFFFFSIFPLASFLLFYSFCIWLRFLGDLCFVQLSSLAVLILLAVCSCGLSAVCAHQANREREAAS